MILILGGTTEGRIAVQTLEEAGTPFFYSTKGDEQEVTLHNGTRLRGAMDVDTMDTFCRQKEIRLLVDAAHPFAEQLHNTIRCVSEQLDIPVIRYERIFPERDYKRITWCHNYQDAINKIQSSRPTSLLALTGVQSISRLKMLWQPGTIRCYFRILNRESSQALARKQNFPKEHLCYYQAGEDERIAMQTLRPEAILLKESGISGGFCEKVEAAQEAGIRIFAICRPDTPGSFIRVNGPHGLRRTVEKLLPEFYPLHSGLTTGSCAAVAAVAATWDLCHPQQQERPETFPLLLPDGETISVLVEPQNTLPYLCAIDHRKSISATVVKDAGDDPDITNGIAVTAHVSIPLHEVSDNIDLFPSPAIQKIIIRGGEGIGTVTMPGLGLEVGSPAINATPLRMIEENVKRCLQSLSVPPSFQPIVVTLSVTGGKEIARRTFNPRLGIEGGISIIGTSGIVKPFSSEAFICSIRKSMKVARATNSPRVVISSGAKSEKFIKACYPDLPPQAFVHYGNFIGETLKTAEEEKIAFVTLGVMIGKAVKLAEGHLDTHSKKVVMNKAFIQSVAYLSGCSEETLLRIEQINLARQLWEIIPEEQQRSFSAHLINLCHRHCAPLLPHGQLDILLITEEGQIFSQCQSDPGESPEKKNS